MRIAVLAGDGIGPEISAQAVKTMQAVGRKVGHEFEFVELPIGWTAIDAHGKALPPEVHEETKRCDAIFLGAVGLPGRDETLSPEERPERAALLKLREGNFANLRPLWLPPCMTGPAHPPVDMVIVRELNGGIYMGGARGRREVDGVTEAFDTMRYSIPEVERIARTAFDAARLRRKKVCSVDKANILACSVLWRETVIRIAEEYPDVELSHQLVDSAAPALVQRPLDFDVLVTGNLFGDILSDLGAVLVRSLGMLPTASLGGKVALYEPAHGSAPDIMGKDLANPIASILSMAMMLRYSFGLEDDWRLLHDAVMRVLESGCRTIDIMEDGCRQVGCSEFGDLVVQQVEAAG